MCGITGLLDLERASAADALTGRVRDMMASIAHRGPDDAGEWTDPAAGVALGFRRLAILDLSPTGRQPMLSPGGRFVIVFNGEIYNFAVLRADLEAAGTGFRGTSDTEVLLAAVEAWGLEEAVRRCNGMFAFALWDRADKTLHLVRDRLGIKPLYYGLFGRTLLFGSELKSLRAHPAFDGGIDRGALALLLRHGYIPAPHSIHAGVRKLPPGTILSVPAGGRELPAPHAYWSLRAVAGAGAADPLTDPAEAVDQLEILLRESVRERMIADVPLGAFLSGGIDSSTVVALMQAQSSRPVRTFTIGFRESGFDEAGHARAVAAHLGTDHTELYVTPQDALDVIPRLPVIYDEPFADASQIPTYLVSGLARRHVTVSLSGDGGDELFGGYNRYAQAAALARIPRPLRRAAGAGLALAGPALRIIPPRFARPLDRALKLAALLREPDLPALYRGLVSFWPDPAGLVIGASEPATTLNDPSGWPDLHEPLGWMSHADMATYLPDDILVKLDRASMAVSLEARVPLLDDHRVVEFAWRLPASIKVREGRTKWPLRQVLYRHVPRELVERPKMGFAVPVDAWLRGPLRGWAAELLDESRLRREGFLEPRAIIQRWQEHLSGRRNWQYALWPALMFQSWLEAAR